MICLVWCCYLVGVLFVAVTVAGVCLGAVGGLLFVWWMLWLCDMSCLFSCIACWFVVCLVIVLF